MPLRCVIKFKITRSALSSTQVGPHNRARFVPLATIEASGVRASQQEQGRSIPISASTRLISGRPASRESCFATMCATDSASGANIPREVKSDPSSSRARRTNCRAKSPASPGRMAATSSGTKPNSLSPPHCEQEWFVFVAKTPASPQETQELSFMLAP